MKDDALEYFCNTLVSYTLRGAHVALNVIWDWEAPAGAGDSHFAYYRGSRARVEVRQGAAEKLPPGAVRGAGRRRRTRPRCWRRSRRGWRRCRPSTRAWAWRTSARSCASPSRTRCASSHEDHFAQVTKRFLRYVGDRKTLPAWERPNMLAKYYVTTRGHGAGPPLAAAARGAPRAQVSARVFPWPRLHEFCAAVFRRLGVPEDDAALAADVLSAADRRGIDSHGVARLRTYVDLLSAGRINPRPQLRVVRESASTATVDGDNGLGLVVGPKANDMAMDKAEQAGTGWVAVCNTNHFGIAGYYVLQAVRARDDRLGHDQHQQGRGPALGRRAHAGHQPHRHRVPRRRGAAHRPRHVHLRRDVRVKIEMAPRRQEAIPAGLGRRRPRAAPPATRATMIEGGALLPLGGDREHGGHKGYGLAVAVDVLSAVLSGANWGPFTPPFAIQGSIRRAVGGEGDRPLLRRHARRRLPRSARVQGPDRRPRADPAGQPARAGHGGARSFPATPSARAQQDRDEHGIPLLAPVLEDLRDISRRTGVALE